MFFRFLHLKRCFRHKYHFTEMLPPFNFLTQYIGSFYYIHIAYRGSWHIADIQQMLAEFVKEHYHLDINLSHLQQNRAWRGESYQRKCLPVSDWITGKKVQKWSEVKSLSRVRLFAASWTVAYQATPSMGFSRQEYWSGLPFPLQKVQRGIQKFFFRRTNFARSDLEKLTCSSLPL